MIEFTSSCEQQKTVHLYCVTLLGICQWSRYKHVLFERMVMLDFCNDKFVDDLSCVVDYCKTECVVKDNNALCEIHSC